MMCNQMSSKLLVAVVCCIAVSGCSNRNSARITGDIKFEGTDVPAGMVVFASNATTCSGQITDGQYEILFQGNRAIPLQDYAVTIFPPSEKFEYDPKTGQEEHVPSGIDPKFFPMKYRSKTTSGLTFSPVAGDNQFHIDMQGK